MHVVVVGGGIVGASAAYYLASGGADVTLCEKSHVGAGATGAGGGIRSQFSTPVNVALSKESISVWDSFEATFGVDLNERQHGYLFLARTEDTAAQLERDVALQREYGFENEFLQPEEAASRCPGISTEPFVGASFSPGDRFVDVSLAVQAFVDAAESAGATLSIGTDVTGIDLDRGERGRVTVRTDEGDVDADYVVNAAGAWAGEIAEMVGVELPVSPRLRRQLLVEPSRPFPIDLPLTMDLDTGAVFYPENEEVMITSGPQETMPIVDPDQYRGDEPIDWTIDVLESLGELATYFDEDSRVRRTIEGVYAQTPDSNPIIEETVPGFVNAVGFSGHGFMHAPATGQLVSEIILDGEPSLVDISALGSDRFEASAPDGEKSFI
ncbi:NAD(P)/FAD-dependent oxidoreductase [Halovivax gelatinilyticus]|uniref:NAD(P)/FAD-dependent oxidoreductase n=1 Tax=Halovivax gelatinilyticus TaxID=2961597 RepID=UPI0020CA32FF|nr:FAD-binding oxidoreductase [Halovivax gelatinilyticus]